MNAPTFNTGADAVTMWSLMRLPKLILSTIGAQAGRKVADPAEAEVPGDFVNGAAIESLARMLECVPAPLFALDRNRQVTAANAAAGKLFGGTITGRNLLAFLRHPPLVDAVEACEAGRQTEPVALPESQGRSGQRRLVARLQAIRPPFGRRLGHGADRGHDRGGAGAHPAARFRRQCQP